MKKSLLVMLMVLGFALQEPVYERMDEYIRCRDVDVIYEGKYVERVENLHCLNAMKKLC